MHEGLADVDRRVVGTKQVLRALDEGRIARAYVAQDADLLLTKRVVDRCYDMDIPCTLPLPVCSNKSAGEAA